MILFSLLAVLLLEQLQPQPSLRFVEKNMLRLSAFLESRFNAGERRYGTIAWLLGVGVLVLVSGGVAVALAHLNPLLAWLWNTLILYLTMGFRQFSHYYTDIRLALRMGKVDNARQLLAEWRGVSTDGLSSSEIASLAIEEALCAAHRQVFGVVACFLLLPGPCGAVLYRASAFFAASWGTRDDEETAAFGSFARRSFAIIDWLPARLTALSFAIVGNFEDAFYRWRRQAELRPDDGLGIVLASAAGAQGLRLVPSPRVAGELAEQTGVDGGDGAHVDSMDSTVGLLWRALVLWILLLLLLGLANLVGG